MTEVNMLAAKNYNASDRLTISGIYPVISDQFNDHLRDEGSVSQHSASVRGMYRFHVLAADYRDAQSATVGMGTDHPARKESRVGSLFAPPICCGLRLIYSASGARQCRSTHDQHD